MIILESNLYSGILDDFFDETSQIQCYTSSSTLEEFLTTNPNGIIKCTNRNSEFINKMLKIFSKRFIKEKFNFTFEDENEFLQEKSVREVVFDKKIFDFNMVNGPKVFYISESRLKRTYNEYLERLGYYIGQFKHIKALDVLPYHSMGKTKYEQLGIDYVLKDVPEATKEQAIEARGIIIGAMKKRRHDMGE